VSKPPDLSRRENDAEAYISLVSPPASREYTNLKKATHAQTFLVYASARKHHARASHRSFGPTIARASWSSCPALRTRVDSAHRRCAYHRFSRHPHDSEGPGDIASTPSSSVRPCGTCSSDSRYPCAGTDCSARQDSTLLGLRKAVPWSQCMR